MNNLHPINNGINPRNYKGPLKIPLIKSIIKFAPAEFEISSLGRTDPIGRGLVRGARPFEIPLLNNTVIK